MKKKEYEQKNQQNKENRYRRSTVYKPTINLREFRCRFRFIFIHEYFTLRLIRSAVMPQGSQHIPLTSYEHPHSKPPCSSLQFTMNMSAQAATIGQVGGAYQHAQPLTRRENNLRTFFFLLLIVYFIFFIFYFIFFAFSGYSLRDMSSTFFCRLSSHFF